MTDQSPIFARTESFMIWLLQHTQKFPKHERFRLAKQIDDAFFSFHACLLHAVKTAQTRQQLQQADVELDKLRAYLRIALELKYTTPEQFQFVSEHIAEIGRLLGGWIKKA
jgi:four helix bundle protein